MEVTEEDFWLNTRGCYDYGYVDPPVGYVDLKKHEKRDFFESYPKHYTITKIYGKRIEGGFMTINSVPKPHRNDVKDYLLSVNLNEKEEIYV